jgi:hypothetical protein
MTSESLPCLPSANPKWIKSSLGCGRFACGRVIQLCYTGVRRDPRALLAGLLDWSGDQPPSSEAIASCRTVEQGEVHIKTIRENRGEVLGFRPLEADGIEPWLFLSQAGWSRECWLQRGYKRLRPATLEEFQAHPVFSTWGYGVIKLLAEKHFGDTT